MPIPSHINQINLLNDFRTNMTSRTGLTAFERDSKVRVLSDTLSEEVIALREEQIAAEYMKQLPNARGKALDTIGDNVGMLRFRAGHANATSDERTVGFFVESGNFGAINSGSPIVLSGTETISSDPNTNELNTSVDYVLTRPITLAAVDALQYVSVRAVNLGTQSNVGSGVLRRHSVVNYTNSASNSLKVTNFYPVLNGTDDEPDEAYRFRLANHYNRLLTNNDTRMKLTALTVPGVVNSRTEPGYFGIGTAGVIALGPENQANTRLISSLQERLNGLRLPGGEYIAVPGVEVTFDFEIEVNPNKPLTNTQNIRLRSEINRAFLDYFRQLTIGSVVDLKLMSTATQRRMATVASFANRNGDRNRIFKRVYVRKSYAGAASDERSRVATGVYALGRDEFASLGTLNIEVL